MTAVCTAAQQCAIAVAVCATILQIKHETLCTCSDTNNFYNDAGMQSLAANATSTARD
jgi:hypothetical protein